MMISIVTDNIAEDENPTGNMKTAAQKIIVDCLIVIGYMVLLIIGMEAGR